VKLNRKQVYGRFKKLMKGAGYGITFHDLRHINASVMAALGIPDIYAMERGGWSNTTTLRTVYQQTFTDERQKVDAQIDGYFMELYRAYNKQYVTDFDTEDEKLNNSAV
jgi:integrase